MSLANVSPSRQGGKCWDPKTRQWRRCGNSVPPASATGGETEGTTSPGQPCCQSPDCCLHCTAFSDFLNCLLQNARNALAPPGGYIEWSVSILLRPLTLTFPGRVCTRWHLGGLNSNSLPIYYNGNEVPCFQIQYTEQSFSPSMGTPFLSSFLLKSQSPHCVDIGVFFLLSPTLVDGNWQFSLLKSATCVNPASIQSIEDFLSQCHSCTGQRP